MRDSTIFKLAAGAGLLAFGARLIFVQPDDLGNRNAGLTGPSGTNEVRRLMLAGDYAGALEVAAERQRERYLNQSGWAAIAQVLIEIQTAGEGDDFIDAAAAMQFFDDVAPRQWLDASGARGWAAYFLGFELHQRHNPEAAVAWRIGAADFERLIREHPDEADAWDWLYRARTYMRLEEHEAARQALADGSNWVEAVFLAEAGDGLPVDSPMNFLRTYGRTWAVVGGVVEAESLWSRLTAALLAQSSPLSIAEDWQRYSNTLFRQDETAGAALATEMSYTALLAVDGASPATAGRAARLWANAARRFSRLEQFSRADDAWEQALSMQQIAAEHTNDPGAWVDYGVLLALRGHLEDAMFAIEQGVELGYTNADRLWNEDAFEPLRQDERFLAAVDSIWRTLEEIRENRRRTRDRGLRPEDGGA